MYRKEIAVWPKEKMLCLAPSIFQNNMNCLLPDNTKSSCSLQTLGTFEKDHPKQDTK